MATRKCKTCQEKLRVEDTHALCWEHIGRSHFCDKCEDLVPFGRYKDYQQFLANCWQDKDEEDGVDKLPVLSPRPGEDGEIAEAAQDSQGALRTRQDGGDHDGGGVEDEGDFGQKSPQASAPSVTNGVGGGGDPPADLTGVWRKVRGLEKGFEGLRSELKTGLVSFKDEMMRFLSGKFSPARKADDEGLSVVSPTQVSVEDEGILEEDSVEEEDDSLVEYKRRMSRIEGGQVKAKVPLQTKAPTATATVSQVSTQQLLVIHLFQDRDKEEVKRKEDDMEERNNDEDSLPLGDLVKSQLGQDDYRGYMSDQVCQDLALEGPVLTNTAAQWARVCLDSSIPAKTHFHEAMWAHVVMSDDSV